MADTLLAKANVGAGTDQLAVDNITGGAAGVVKVALGIAGTVDGYVSSATPMPVVFGAEYDEDTVAANGDKGIFILGIRRDSDTSTAADGDYTALKMDESGRLKVASQPGNYPPITGSIAAVAATVFADCQRYSNLMIHCSGTFAGINCTFEGSLDSTNGTDGAWFAVQAARSNANTPELTTGVLGAAPAYAWELSVNGLKYFRVRCTARTSGTQNWVFLPGTYATEPIPVAQVTATQPVSGTVTATLSAPAAPTASIVNSAATTNGTVVKASAGTLYSITASNTGAAVAFLKLHNSATVTAGSTAVAMTIPIPAGAVVTIPFGSQGMRYGTGICLSITNLAADTDTTAIAAGQVKVNTAFI